MKNEIDFKSFVHVFVPENFTELLNWSNSINKFHEKEWIYRGQRDFNWALTSTLERYNKELNLKYKGRWRDIYETEKRIIRQFDYKTRKTFKSKIEKISYLQHYGIWSRLIDFTHNFDIALYFATSNMDNKPSALFAFSKEYLRISNMEFKNGTVYYKDLSINDEIDKYLIKSMNTKILYANPTPDNERVKAQSGCFLFSSNLHDPIEKSIHQTLGTLALNTIHPMLIKFKILPELKPDIDNYLDHKNINSDTLLLNEYAEYGEKIEAVKEFFKL